MSFEHIIMIAAFVILLILSGFFSSSEMAITASNRIKIKAAAEGGGKRALAAKYLTDNYTKTLSSVLFSNSLVNIAASTILTVLFTAAITSAVLAESAATITTTLLLLIFGEIYPKILGSAYADRYVYFCAIPIRIVSLIFFPVTALVSFLIEKASVIWKPAESAPTATADELVSIVDEMEDDGGFTKTEGEIIRGAINFTEKTAKDILTPRVDLLAYDIDDRVAELAHNSALLDYARFPVYKENLDHIIGILTTRSFACEYLKNGEDTDIASLLVKPVFVHMTRDISSILTEMRDKKCEMAIVIDEFGGTLGAITVEDIVEEIVGDIFDENDDVETEYTLREGVYHIDGGMNIYDLFDILEYNDRGFESEYTTVGGFAAEMLDKIPEEGDTFTFDNMRFAVEKVNGMRVEQISLTIIPQEEDE